MNENLTYGKLCSRYLVDVRKGPTITIDCGDLPEVPDWLVKELDVIKARLDRDIVEHVEHSLSSRS